MTLDELAEVIDLARRSGAQGDSIVRVRAFRRGHGLRSLTVTLAGIDVSAEEPDEQPARRRQAARHR